MKQDSLEDMLRRRRAELDTEEPDVPLIWEGVQSQLQRRRRRPVRWLAAASVLLLLGSVLYYRLSPNLTTPVVADCETAPPDREDLIFAGIDESLAKEEAKAACLVRDKEAMLNLTKVDQQKYHDIFVELRLLEELHEDFKKDLPEYGEKDRLLKTLMKYYDRRLKILDRLSNEIQKEAQEAERDQSI
ncbi:MAG: hypothetical protein AAFP02_24455 [Bacteroidota bacterium]